MKALLLLAVAATGLAAVPATAKPHGQTRCVRWSHGHCVVQQRWNRGAWRSAYVHQRKMERREARREARRASYRMGYRFAPSYAYTPYASIPRNYVTQYNLNPDNRYVYRDNYIYQVNPRTYAVERILNALTR